MQCDAEKTKVVKAPSHLCCHLILLSEKKSPLFLSAEELLSSFSLAFTLGEAPALFEMSNAAEPIQPKRFLHAGDTYMVITQSPEPLHHQIFHC